MTRAGETRIVIVGGPPASGKTTLAERLAADFALPLIAKDGIKETLFDSVGIGDLEWSRQLGRASFALIWHVLELELAAGRSALIEGNFDVEHSAAELARLGERCGFVALQIHCHAPVDVLYARYRQRLDDRHPGHADAERMTDVPGAFGADRYLLPLPGDPVLVDTTSFDALDYDRVHAAVAAHLTR